MKIQPEWIEWKGGKMPVDGKMSVAYQMRSGKTGVTQARDLYWGHQRHTSPYDVVFYSVDVDIEPYKPKPKWEAVVFQTDSAALLFKGVSVLRFSNTYTAVENAHRIADALNAAGVEL